MPDNDAETAMPLTITAFERSPDGGKGLARDTRVRWALEEVGQPYEVRLVSFAAMKQPAHLALHPFGQTRSASANTYIAREIWSNASSTKSNTIGASPHDTTSSMKIISLLSSSSQSASGSRIYRSMT